MADNIPKRVKNLNKEKFFCILEEQKDYVQDYDTKKMLSHYLLYEFKDQKELDKFIETKQTRKEIKYYIGQLSDFVNYTILEQREKETATKKKNQKEKEYCVVVDSQADDIILLNAKRTFNLYEFNDKNALEKFIETGKTEKKKKTINGLISNLSNYTVVRINKKGIFEKVKKENLVTVKNINYYGIIHIYPSMSRYLISSDTYSVEDLPFLYKDFRGDTNFKESSEQDFIDYMKTIGVLDIVKLSEQMITFDLIKNLQKTEDIHMFLNVFGEPRILFSDDKAFFEYNEALYKNNLETIKKFLEQNEKTHPELAIQQLKDVLNAIGFLGENGNVKAPYLNVFENNKNKKMVKTKERKNN